MIDVGLNFILFLSRLGTFVITAILLFNLISEWRADKDNKDGLQTTRLAIITITLAMFIENGVYMLGYLHGSFTNVGLNQWLFNARPLVIFSRILIFYGFLRLYLLFCCHKKE